MIKMILDWLKAKKKTKTQQPKSLEIKIVPDHAELIPLKQTLGAAAYDLRADVSGGFFPLLPYMPTLISCGFKVEIPYGYHGKICIRSSMGKDGIVIPNAPGIIDSDYRGKVKVLLLNLTDKVYEIKYGQRIAQMLIEKNSDVNWLISDSLSDTIRSDGGFGSTGKIK